MRSAIPYGRPGCGCSGLGAVASTTEPTAYNKANCGPLGWANKVRMLNVAPFIEWAPDGAHASWPCGDLLLANRVAAFQEAKGLPVDGKLGPGTLAALKGAGPARVAAVAPSTGVPAAGERQPPIIEPPTPPSWLEENRTLVLVGGAGLLGLGLWWLTRRRAPAPGGPTRHTPPAGTMTLSEVLKRLEA